MFQETVLDGVVGSMLLLYIVEMAFLVFVFGELLLKGGCKTAYLVSTFVGGDRTQTMAWTINNILTRTDKLLLQAMEDIPPN